MAMSFTFKGVVELNQMLLDMEEKATPAAIEGLQRWAELVFDVSQQIVPTDTGNLGSSGKLSETPSGAIIEYTAPYAAAVHYGYVRHKVEPKRKKVLKFEATGGGKYKGRIDRLNQRGSRKNIKWAFSRGHYVPARASRSKPQPWLEIAIRRSLPYLEDYLLEAITDAVPALRGGS